MAAWGFRFGNHTAFHANLAEVSPGQAEEEVTAARQDLERELGDAEGSRWLAYPYGKAVDMTDLVRGRLPQLGMRCCLSAFGGTNPPDFDEWDIHRQAIDHKFSNLRLAPPSRDGSGIAKAIGPGRTAADPPGISR